MFTFLRALFAKPITEEDLLATATDLTIKAMQKEDEAVAVALLKNGGITEEERKLIFKNADAAWRKYRKHRSVKSENLFPTQPPAVPPRGVVYETKVLIDKVRKEHIKHGYGVYQPNKEETTNINIYIDDIKFDEYRKDMPYIRWVQN